MTKLQKISNHVKVLTKLYPHMDKKRIRNAAYFVFSRKWKDLVETYPNSLISYL